MRKDKEEIQKKFVGFATSSYGKFMLEYLQMLSDEFADIRNYPKLSNEVRLEVVKFIDENFIEKINIARGVEPKEGDNWR